jgi:hypothetical protein
MTTIARHLGALFRALPIPADGGADGESFATVAFPASPAHLIGKGADGRIAILLALDTGFPLGPIPSVRLENLEVIHAARCQIARSDGSCVPGTFSVVRCLADDPAIAELFIDVMASVTQQFVEPPPADTAARVMDRVIRLFRNLARPSPRVAQGLWAELFLIAESTDPAQVAATWRTTLYDRTDFASDNHRLEVKSTANANRVHKFSMDQLRVPTGTYGVVASLLCQRTAGGLSIRELWSTVRGLLAATPELVLRTDEIVTSTLGDVWKESLLLRYDWQTAKASIRFYAMESVPSVGHDLPPAISDVRFSVDLSDVQAIEWQTVKEHGGLMRAACPKHH